VPHSKILEKSGSPSPKSTLTPWISSVD